MDATSYQLLQSALALPDHDRADLAAELIASLDPGADADYEAAWSAGPCDSGVSPQMSQMPQIGNRDLSSG
jgi:hypothetical protein